MRRHQAVVAELGRVVSDQLCSFSVTFTNTSIQKRKVIKYFQMTCSTIQSSGGSKRPTLVFHCHFCQQGSADTHTHQFKSKKVKQLSDDL